MANWFWKTEEKRKGGVDKEWGIRREVEEKGKKVEII